MNQSHIKGRFSEQSKIDEAEGRMYELYKCQNLSFCQASDKVEAEFNLTANEKSFIEYQATGW